MSQLATGQPYATNAFELLLFDIALELTFFFQDTSRTRNWIQRSKLWALLKVLKSSLDPRDLQNGPEYLSLAENLKFEYLQ